MYYFSDTQGLDDMTPYGHNMETVGLLYTTGPIGEENGAVQFTGQLDDFAQITNIVGSELIPQNSFTISLQVTYYCYSYHSD